MKIRSGFVSNSSSSSFIVKVGEPFNTIFEIAEYMIPKREWENDNELLQKLKKLKELSTFSEGLSFSSCNFNTYIIKDNDYFLIDTCNNHDWDMWDFNIKGIPPQYYDEYGDYSTFRIPYENLFYNLEHDVVGCELDYSSQYKYETQCKCHVDYMMIDNIYQCPKCRSKAKEK